MYKNNNRGDEFIQQHCAVVNSMARKYRKKNIKPSNFSIFSLALLTVIFGITALTEADKRQTLEHENALLKTTLQQQTEHAPTSPASLEVPPLPPSYSEFIKFNGWTVCEENNCDKNSI